MKGFMAKKDVNAFYKNFYLRRFLPHLMGARNYHTNRMKSIQPITYCFVDEYSHKPIKMLEVDLKTLKPYSEATFADRLHHHAILTVNGDTSEKMNELLGNNMLVNNDFKYQTM
ncbi:MAG: hypothetical protein ACI8PW_000819 [Methylophilaceae bacterium]